VALANSTVFNTSGPPITDVRTAVLRLGFRYLRSLAAAVVTRQLAVPLSATDRRLAARLWEHTAHVAALAQVIARKVTHLDPETAMFAGIVHEVGGFYLISRAAEYPGLLDEDFSAWNETGEAELGRALLKVLGVPQAVIDAIEVCWAGFLACRRRRLAIPCCWPTNWRRWKVRCAISTDVPREGTAASIDMLIGEETLVEIMRESAADVRSLAAALRL
jgi:hypothetical protein